MSSVVPEGWETHRIKGVLSKVIDNRGKTPPLSESGHDLIEVACIRSDKQSVDYEQATKSVSDDTYQSWFRNGHPNVGDTLLPTVGSIGEFAFVDSNKGCIAQNLVALRPSEVIEPLFLYFQCYGEVVQMGISRILMEAVQPSLRVPQFLETSILIPPLPEQKKIASILTSVDEVIKNTQKQIDKLQDLKKATMNELLTKGISHTEFKDSELGRIPKSWEVKSIGEVAANVNDKFLPINNDSVVIKYIGLEHIQSETNMIITSGSSGDVVSTKTVFKEGDTLFGKLRPYLKKVVIATFSGICSTDILVIRATKIIIPQFLFRILSTDNTIRFAMKRAAGNIMPRTSWKELKEFRFGLPLLSEQQKIASMFSLMDKTIKEKQRKLSQTQSLKKSLMQDLLTGKVRVSVN